MTTQTLRLVSVLLSDPEAEWYGLKLAAEAGLKSGTVYLVLARLEQAGWLTSHWEDIDPSVEGRPRRRLYLMTADGIRGAQQGIEEHAAALGLRPQSGARSRPAPRGASAT